MKIIKKYPIIAVLIVVSVSYLRVLGGFFQQDEWLSFAYRMVAVEGGFIGLIKDAFAPSVGHFQPLNSLLINILFSLFKVNYLPYAFVSIFLHLVNVYLVYNLSKYFFRSKKAGAIISLIFGVAPSIYQATSWVLADLGVHLSTLFAILTITEFMKFSRLHSYLQFNRVLLYLVLSLLFKEISIGIFALIFIAIFASKSIRDKRKYLTRLIIVFLVYVALRVAMIFIPSSYSRDKLVTESQYSSALIYNLATLPVKGLTQAVLPPRLLVNEAYLAAQYLSRDVTAEPNTPDYDVFVQKKVLEVVTFANFFIIGILSLMALTKTKNTALKMSIIWGLAFILFNSPVFAMTPERSGRIFILDSRNLYLLSVAASFVVYSTLSLLIKRNFLFFIGIFIVSLLNIYGLDRELKEIEGSGKIRREVLDMVYNLYPVLPPRIVFYTESDTSYYGLPENEKILPFQSGLGQTLLVWYGKSEKFSTDFYSNRFLWEITDQGYQESGGRGFGYFRDINLLKDAIREYNLPESSIIAFRWISEEERLIDVTGEVREEI